MDIRLRDLYRKAIETGDPVLIEQHRRLLRRTCDWPEKSDWVLVQEFITDFVEMNGIIASVLLCGESRVPCVGYATSNYAANAVHMWLNKFDYLITFPRIKIELHEDLQPTTRKSSLMPLLTNYYLKFDPLDCCYIIVEDAYVSGPREIKQFSYIKDASEFIAMRLANVVLPLDYILAFSLEEHWERASKGFWHGFAD